MDKLLNDPTLPLQLEPMTLDKPELIQESSDTDKVNFTFGVNGKLEAFIFNSETDEDPDEIFGKTDSPVPFAPSKAWLKYIADANIKLESGLDIKSVGFSIDAKAGLRSYVYRKHQATEKLQAAQLNDIASLKTIFSLKQIRELAPDEAVGLAFSGNLKASVTLAWSDVWTTGFKTLTSFLAATELVKVSFGPEASIKATVSVEESFHTQVVKKAQGKYWLKVKRKESRSFSAGVSLSVSVAIENPSVITDHLDKILENVLEVSFTKLESIAKKKADELTKAEKGILESVADRLGWNEDNNLNRLKTEIKDLKAKYAEKIEGLVKTKVKAGFTYEYLRSSEEDSLFSATLNDDGLKQFHFDILRGNTVKMIEFALSKKDSPLLQDVTFLNVKIQKQKRTWGFSIGFGNWAASDQNEVGIDFKSRQTEKGIQLAYEGRRTFEDKVGGEKRRWKIDFNATMPMVSNHAIPRANEFEYSLYHSYEWENPEVKETEIMDFLDLCRLWNVINEGQFNELIAELPSGLEGAKDITYTCHATYPPAIFKAIMLALQNDSPVHYRLWCQSLGASLPYWDKFTIRKSPELRATHYAPVWKEYLETDSVIPHQIAYANLKKVDKKLAEHEYDYTASTGFINFNAFAFIAKSSKETKERWLSFKAGMKDLSIASGDSATIAHNPVINHAFRKMHKLWLFPHHVKSFGHFMTVLGSQYPALFNEAVFTGEIRYTKGGKEKVEVFGKA